MSSTKLYGRESFVKDIITDLTDQKIPVVFIQGFSGMGKTSISKYIKAKFEQDYGYIVSQYTVESNIQSYEEPFLILLKDIVNSIPDNDITVKDILEATGKKPENRLARILSGVAQDLSKKIGIESTVKVFGEIFVESVDTLVAEAKKLASEDRASFYTEYTEALLAIAPLCKTKHFLIIDQLEKANEPLIRFLISFPQNKPECIRILLTINDEREEGIECLEILRPDYQYIGVQPRRLAGITKIDLREWLNSEKRGELSDEVLTKAITQLDGRPLLLRSWIDNGDYSLESLSSPDAKTYGFYNNLFSRLDLHAQQIAILLAHIPLSLPVDINFIERISGLAPLDINIILNDLRNKNFIVKDGDCFKYSHQLVRTFVLNEKSSLTHVQKKEILHKLEAEAGSISVSVSSPSLLEVKLELTTSIDNIDDFDFYFAISQKQLEEGAYKSAINLAGHALNNSRGVDLTDELKIKMLLIKCKALEQLGEYNKAISTLKQQDLTSLQDITKAKVQTLLAELNLRLNQYEDSLRDIASAESILVDIDDAEGLATLYIIKGHVLRDIEKYDDALSLARYLSEHIYPRVDNALVQAHILRSISRAKASLFMPEAIIDAINAKIIATKKNSKRHIGSAEFTLGEAYRLNKQFDKAKDSYGAGLDIANSLGNRDLEIYCKLGLAATMLCGADIESSYNLIQDLSKLSSDKFPVESLHTKMFTYIHNLLINEAPSLSQIEEIDEEYRSRYSRSIPGAYLRELRSKSEVEQRAKYVKDNPIRL